MSPALDAAFERLRRGDVDGAMAIVVGAVERAASDHGERSPALAEAHADRAALCMALGDLGRAAASYRTAVEATDAGDVRTAAARCRYLRSLAEVLERLGLAEEAEHAARDAIAAGAGSIDGAHARVVFARLLLARPDGAEPASDLARAALIALWGEGHAAVDPVIVLDAVAATAAGRVASLEVYLDALPTDRLDGVVRAAYAHAESTPEAALVVLMRLAAYLADRRSPELAIGPWVVATNVARRLGDHRARIDALRRLVGAHRGGGRSADAARAGLGLATAWVDAGESAAAEAAYRGALADAGSDRILASEVRSALGLFLASDGRPDEARPVLQDAAASGSPRAFVALGVFLAHTGDPESARAVLELAARALDPDEPDRLPAMVHLDSLASGRPCGCGDPDAVLAATVRAVIAPDAPDGLLTALAVEVHDGESQVRVGLGREPRPGELEQLDALIRDAIAVTRRRLGR